MQLEKELLDSLRMLLESGGGGLTQIKDMRQLDYVCCVLEKILSHGLKQGLFSLIEHRPVEQSSSSVDDVHFALSKRQEIMTLQSNK